VFVVVSHVKPEAQSVVPLPAGQVTPYPPHVPVFPLHATPSAQQSLVVAHAVLLHGVALPTEISQVFVVVSQVRPVLQLPLVHVLP
jgi:hypothetical protein